MRQVRFVISRVYAGWFDVHLKQGDAVLHGMSASDVWGGDSPRAWLTMLSALLRGEAQAGYALLDEEPGTYILALERGETEVLTFAYTRWENWGREETIPLYGLCPFSELAEQIPQEIEVCFREAIDFPLFVRSVYEAFLPYEQKHLRDKYEGNWMPFPQEAWCAFRDRVRELGWA